MTKLSTTQTNAINAYAKFLEAGQSYGDAMRAAAKSLGGTPCPTFLAELAKVHAAKYACNYTWDGQGRAVFFNGEESTRETRNDAARKSWARNVMVWFAEPKAKAAPKANQRVSKELRELAKALIEAAGDKATALRVLRAL